MQVFRHLAGLLYIYEDVWTIRRDGVYSDIVDVQLKELHDVIKY